jgi:site-specific DNA recombinase
MQSWFTEVLRQSSQKEQNQAGIRSEELQRQISLAKEQQSSLLNLYLLKEIEGVMYSTKSKELRDRESMLKLQLEACDRMRQEDADVTIRTFELSQRMREKWLTAEYAEKRCLLEIVAQDWTLTGATLVPVLRKPFDLLAKGLLLETSTEGGT